jgi:hypothetical protein
MQEEAAATVEGLILGNLTERPAPSSVTNL